MKLIIVILLAGFAFGCAGRDTPAGSAVEAQGGEYVPLERNATRLGNRRVGVRVPPCSPFYADDLTAWAKEIGCSSRHDRKANVSVDSQGWVRCNSQERVRSTAREYEP